MTSPIRDPRVELVHMALEEVVSFLVANFPVAKQVSLELIEAIFIPSAVAKQLVLLFALETGLVTVQQISGIIQSLLGNFSSRTRLLRQLREEQQKTTTQDEWMDIAEKLDRIQGNDVWRSDPNCEYYERDRISARIDEYVHLMRRQDIFELMFVLRGSIGRNKFGLLHEDLFTRALAGSKVLVETYHNVVCAALDFVCDADVLPGEDPIPTAARLAFFNETRHAYGRTALLLSGGAALGFYHAGVVKTLIANGLMPRVLGGSSAGSIVCAMIGTRTDEECMNDLFESRGTTGPGHSGRLALNFFRPHNWSPEHKEMSGDKEKNGGFWGVYRNTAGAFRDAKRTLQGFVPVPLRHISSFLYNLVTLNSRAKDIFKHDTAHFRECVKSNIGDFTFQEAFDRTGRILNIVVTPLNKNDPPRLLNYLTAPHVLVWSAAVASSSLPGVFEANRLVVKEADGWERYESGGRQAFSDGSMESDLPMQQLSEMFNVNHFIVSQANPHAVMFASYNQRITVWTSPLSAMVQSIMTLLKSQLRTWLANLVECIGLKRWTPFALEDQRGLPTQFFTQEYEGRRTDVSLIPWLGHRGLLGALLHIIYNPSEAEFREWIEAAQRETWKHIPAIKSHIAEEITLDRCVQRLRRRVAHESWAKQTKVSTSDGKTFGDRVPSFYASPSLSHLGGLGVTDQAAIALHTDQSQSDPKLRKEQKEESNISLPKAGPQGMMPEITINSGWAGMGLRGNRSSGNLTRSQSDASGLFIDEDDVAAGHQQPGEGEGEMVGLLDSQRARNNSEKDLQQGYMKTTSMAQFYYRKTRGNYGSTGNLGAPTSESLNQLDKGSIKKVPLERRKSKSYADLDTGRANFDDFRAASP